MNFSFDVTALDKADLAISSGCDVKTYIFIPSGEAANVGDAAPARAHAPTASFARSRLMLLIFFSPFGSLSRVANARFCNNVYEGKNYLAAPSTVREPLAVSVAVCVEMTPAATKPDFTPWRNFGQFHFSTSTPAG